MIKKKMQSGASDALGALFLFNILKSVRNERKSGPRPQHPPFPPDLLGHFLRLPSFCGRFTVKFLMCYVFQNFRNVLWTKCEVLFGADQYLLFLTSGWNLAVWKIKAPCQWGVLVSPSSNHLYCRLLLIAVLTFPRKLPRAAELDKLVPFLTNKKPLTFWQC